MIQVPIAAIKPEKINNLYSYLNDYSFMYLPLILAQNDGKEYAEYLIQTRAGNSWYVAQAGSRGNEHMIRFEQGYSFYPMFNWSDPITEPRLYGIWTDLNDYICSVPVEYFDLDSVWNLRIVSEYPPYFTRGISNTQIYTRKIYTYDSQNQTRYVIGSYYKKYLEYLESDPTVTVISPFKTEFGQNIFEADSVVFKSETTDKYQLGLVIFRYPNWHILTLKYELLLVDESFKFLRVMTNTHQRKL